MPDFDTAAAAQVDSGQFAPAWLFFVDFLGDPLRVTTCGKALSFAGTGDPDLDGQSFAAFRADVVDVSDIEDSDTGSDTLTVTLSGIRGIDDTLLAEIEDKTKWQGRLVRVWQQIFDVTGTAPQGALVQYYTGYASLITIKPGPQTSQIAMQVEKYLASSSEASNRSYLNQKDYDPADTSAQATLAAANMGRGSGGAAPASTPTGGGSMGYYSGYHGVTP